MDLSAIGNDSERFFRTMLQLSNSPILITDAKARDNPIILVNPAFERATGYRAEEVLGRNCRLLQNDDRQQPGRTVIANAVRTGTSCDALLRNYRKDGQMFWIRIYMFPVTDSRGDITHFVGIQHEVTAETEFVHALKEKQAFIDTSPDVYLKVAADLTIVQVNGAFEAISGWSAAELVGKNAVMLIPPERLADARMQFRTLLLQNEPSRFNAEYTCRAGDRITIEWTATRTEAKDHLLLVGRDITAKQVAQREAARANAQVASILGSITEGCFSLDRGWNCTYMNAKAGEWLNRRPADLIGKNLWDEFPQAIGGAFYDTYHHAMRTQQFSQCEAFYAPVGRWLEARAYPSDDGLTVFFLDISERKKHELALVYSATHDSLTDLPNRSACLQTLSRRLGTSGAAREEVAVIFIDLDRFKEINDAFGHAAGDEVLEQIGRRLLGFSSDTCYPSRISGDEFVIIVTGDGEAKVRILALQILDSIAAPIVVKEREITLGGSIGIALAGKTNMSADDLINQADTAMYLSKSKGRHAITVFNGDVNNWNLRRHRLRQDMLHALHNGEFLLHYQPQVSLMDNCVVGAEALIRWQHPEYGLLSPSAFLEIAEESPLIVEMGAWVFNEACRQLRHWQELGHSLQMSVNVSARQLASRDLPGMMEQAIKGHGLSAHFVKLEVTESMLAQDFDAAAQVLAALKQKGFRIALDDFGTGYSNLAYISRLPVTAIKIDRSFVTGLTVDKTALPLITGIVALAKSLDLTVVCEGIETPEQRKLLESTQCDSIQGYLISRPLPAEDFYSGFLKTRFM
ncbi:EAL and GGDEF domain-containing protein [Massilia niabensis]|uniref:EAL domain-containing protein n=1 Tax=Massilia niabensis TaxID=544910 RepID=A0ABW0L5P7_9BURK